MKAHIVGGGFGGLAAAAYLIRNTGVSGQDITIYEADERMGGGLFLGPAPSLMRNSDVHSTCLMPSLPQATRLFPSKKNSLPLTPATRSTTERASSIATATSCMARVSG